MFKDACLFFSLTEIKIEKIFVANDYALIISITLIGPSMHYSWPYVEVDNLLI